MQIDWLWIDDHVIDKIESKHRVTVAEVEEAVFSPSRSIFRTRDEAYKVYSQSDSGRYLMVIVVEESTPGLFAVKTARDMVPRERKEYARKRKTRR